MHKLKVLLPVILVLAAFALSPEARASDQKSGAQANAMRALNESASNLEQLDKIHANTVELYNKLSALYSALDKKVTELEKLAAQGGNQQQLIQATRQMQETQMSFNLQYLQLQSQMQNENRQYTAVSNIMKTKHDTVKNSISNIR